MSDGEWTNHDDALVAHELLPQEHPSRVATLFLSQLLVEPVDATECAAFVTPESRDDWGDFTAAQEFVLSLTDPGISASAVPAAGALDVVRVKILEGITQGAILRRGSEVRAHVVTLVWRPELDGWMVHAVGDMVPARALPRTSPGVAPDVNA